MWATPSTKKKGRESFKIYFNPTNYSVEEELATIANLSEDVPTKQIIQKKFKSDAYVKLLKIFERS